MVLQNTKVEVKGLDICKRVWGCLKREKGIDILLKV